MSQSYTSIRVHYTFSTKERTILIPEHAQERVWSFMAGIAKKNEMIPLKIGGVADHCHAFVILPVDMSVMKGIQLLKAGSSKFINQSLSKARFEWQKGYFAGSVSPSITASVIKYIETQRKHHKKMSFEDELKVLMQRHALSFVADDSIVPEGT